MAAVIHYEALDHSKLDPKKEYLYILQTKDATYFSKTVIPTCNTSVEDFYDWTQNETLGVNFNLTGFVTSIKNSEILKSYNVTIEADKIGVDLSTVDIKEFIDSFKHTQSHGYWQQIEWYLQYIKNKMNKKEN